MSGVGGITLQTASELNHCLFFLFTPSNMASDVLCYCGVGARRLVTKKEGRNKGRWFWTVSLCKNKWRRRLF